MAESKYGRNLVRKPVYELRAGEVKGRQNPTMTLMSNDLVPGSNIYLEVGWVWEIPEPNPHILKHSHSKYNEIVLHIGGDYNNPEDLGAEIEFAVGGEPLVFDHTSALFVPAGVTHGPVIWKKVRRPHLQMAIVLGAGTLAEANPGGHEK
ncbi:MAG TPA: hypothetical protein VJ441_00750 [Dehalococcoidia bacterium]|nr:hypothetical protein [Dehalococcoidia bacterium]